METRPKIGFVVPDAGAGGIAAFYRTYQDVLANANFETTLIAADPFTSNFGEGPARGPKWAPLFTQVLNVADQAYQRALLKDADVLELCDWPLGFAPAVLSQSVPYIVQCHGSMGQIAEHDPHDGRQLEAGLVQLIEPQLMRYAHRVQTSSYANKKFWERATGRPVEMIRPAFALPPLPHDESIDAVGRVFGRLQRWKGPHILCEALRILGRRTPQIHWHGSVKPWGTGDWPADRRLAADFPDVWRASFHHRPAVPRQQVFKLQAAALFNVVPSTWDVFNFTAVEAMAAARPAIVSTGAGASELIVDGENGFIFESGNAAALADVIARVLAMSEQQRCKVGAAGRETIRVELDPARIAEQRIAACNEAIRSFHASPPQKPHDWLVRLMTPGADVTPDFNALMDPVPLRALGRHMVRRITSKVRGKPTP